MCLQEFVIYDHLVTMHELKHMLDHEVEVMDEVRLAVQNDIQRAMVVAVMIVNVLQYRVIVTK
jgi:hypothetical protein